MTALAFLLGGAAMIFIGWVWGRDSPIDGAYAGAVVLAGIAGLAGGTIMLVRLFRER